MFEIKSNRKLCGFWCSLFKSDRKAQPPRLKYMQGLGIGKGLYYNNVTDRRSIINVVLVFFVVLFQNHIFTRCNFAP